MNHFNKIKELRSKGLEMMIQLSLLLVVLFSNSIVVMGFQLQPHQYQYQYENNNHYYYCNDLLLTNNAIRITATRRTPTRRRSRQSSLSFAVQQSGSFLQNKCCRQCRIERFSSNTNNFDYEYIPPRNAEEGRRVQQQQQQQQKRKQQQQRQQELQSSYPENTPAGLRGEAIRSAIRASNRCIGYNLCDNIHDDGTRDFAEAADTILQCGIVQLSSPNIESLLQYMNGKFTQHFTSSKVMSSSSLIEDYRYYYTDAALLNGKGRIIDMVGIAIVTQSSSGPATAYTLTSPGHSSQSIYNMLEPYIFPMDQVTIELLSSDPNNSNNNNGSNNVVIFSLLASQNQAIQECYEQYIIPQLALVSSSGRNSKKIIPKQLPSSHQCTYTTFTATDTERQQQISILIVPNAKLPSCAGYGYTFYIWSSSSSSSSPTQQQQWQSHIGHSIWKYLISENCMNGPIHVGSLEYDTLRIECGTPAYNSEMTATISSRTNNNGKNENTEIVSVSDSNKKTETTPASPLELGLDHLIDITSNKGCYQGQEGVASILKNPRGPPRTLYHVIFPDETNIYDYQSEGEYVRSGNNMNDENLTRTPLPNDTLFVLGSNEEIMVGRITSVAEPSGTGEPITMALALIRRPDSIFSSMKQMGIDLPNTMLSDYTIRPPDQDDGSILIPPPPIDVLDGLEVIIGGTYTIGTLRMLPTRRKPPKFLFTNDDIPSFVQNLPREQDMYDLVPLTKMNDRTDRTVAATTNAMSSPAIQNAVIESKSNLNDTFVTTVTDTQPHKDDGDNDDDDNTISDSELQRAMIEAENAAKEAQRKAEKLELLRQRAEEAIARRKQKKQSS